MKKVSVVGLVVASFAGCAPPHRSLVIPAEAYARQIKNYGVGEGHAAMIRAQEGHPDPSDEPHAKIRFVSDGDSAERKMHNAVADVKSEGTLDGGREAPLGPIHAERSAHEFTRDYPGALDLGDPGISSSLWKESHSASDLFRDSRAWQPMDLLTISIVESAEGKKSADTEVKQKSTVVAAIEHLLGLDNAIKAKNDGANVKLDPTALLNASTQNDYKGEGQTNRKDELKATISAMVAEVLPSGILRVEGQKIISVNNEEQMLVISGLVRPRDISSTNEVSSSKIANLRIDYFGSGTVAEAQYGGWAGRLLRTLWPF